MEPCACADARGLLQLQTGRPIAAAPTATTAPGTDTRATAGVRAPRTPLQTVSKEPVGTRGYRDAPPPSPCTGALMQACRGWWWGGWWGGAGAALRCFFFFFFKLCKMHAVFIVLAPEHTRARAHARTRMHRPSLRAPSRSLDRGPAASSPPAWAPSPTLGGVQVCTPRRDPEGTRDGWW